MVSFEISKLASLAALMSLLFIEIQWNGLLRAKGVVILDTGHHLTSHPTDINILDKYKMQKYKNLFILL